MEKPLERIRSIEHSIDQIRVKIQVMNRERCRQSHKIEQIVNRSIPKIKVKIKDGLFEQKKQKQFSQDSRVSECRIKQLKERKFVHEKQISKTKEQILAQKIMDSQNLKNISKRNDQLVKLRKEQEIQNKRIRQARVRKMEEKSKQNIQIFHQEKQKYLKDQKKQEYVLAEKKVRALVKRLNTLHCEEQKIQKLRGLEIRQMAKLRMTMTKLDKIKPKDFCSVGNQLRAKQYEIESINKEDAQAVLVLLNEKSFSEVEPTILNEQ